MSELWKRTLFGALFVACVVCSILLHPMAFVVLFAVFACWAVDEFHRLMGSSGPLRGSAIVCTLILWLMACTPFFELFGEPVWLMGDLPFIILSIAYALILFGALIDELWHQAPNPVANWGNLLSSQVMIALPFCSMALILLLDKYLLLALFVLIWVNDTGAYCVGSLTAKRENGNHKMFPRVSPKKSWEGLFGGFAFAIGAAYILNHFGWFDVLMMRDGEIVANMTQNIIVILFALVACGFGTLGDLMESLMKRTIGVKDSGRFLPGHGGVLDRFDSLLLAAPMIAIFSWVCYGLLLLF